MAPSSSSSPSTTIVKAVPKSFTSVDAVVRLLETVEIFLQSPDAAASSPVPFGYCAASLFHSLVTTALGFKNLKQSTSEAILQLLMKSESEEHRHATPPPKGEPFFSLFRLVEFLPTIEKYDVRDQAPTQGAQGTSQVSDLEVAALLQKLPIEKTPAAAAARKKLFHDFDPNGNGYLSLAEIDKGARDVLRMTELFDCKPVLMRAFQTARTAVPPSAANHNGDYITRRTFRLLLWYLAKYFELWRVFSKVDEDGDRRVDQDELSRSWHLVLQFLQAGDQSRSETLNVEDVFDEIDSDDGGKILFEEFALWALKKGAGMQLGGEGEDDDD